ncbi:MAG TPA: hypothetical protein PKE58_02060, partial [Acidobacteriota bacterium]|nr:hypothetical protein [Acidobacteriota bacterium]
MMSKKLSLRWGVWILIALSVGSTYLNPKITGTFKQISGDPEFEREKKEFLEINLFWWKYLEQLLPA